MAVMLVSQEGGVAMEVKDNSDIPIPGYRSLVEIPPFARLVGNYLSQFI